MSCMRTGASFRITLLKGQKVACPIVMPSVDKSILLKWAGEEWDSYADVNLTTLETSHHVVDDSDVLENESYDLGESAKEWKIFSKRIKEWSNQCKLGQRT